MLIDGINHGKENKNKTKILRQKSQQGNDKNKTKKKQKNWNKKIRIIYIHTWKENVEIRLSWMKKSWFDQILN